MPCAPLVSNVPHDAVAPVIVVSRCELGRSLIRINASSDSNTFPTGLTGTFRKIGTIRTTVIFPLDTDAEGF
jgi:hypothetical protein